VAAMRKPAASAAQVCGGLGTATIFGETFQLMEQGEWLTRPMLSLIWIIDSLPLLRTLSSESIPI
jgi:hypothetical protein